MNIIEGSKQQTGCHAEPVEAWRAGLTPARTLRQTQGDKSLGLFNSCNI
jgi:hypothetical protein